MTYKSSRCRRTVFNNDWPMMQTTGRNQMEHGMVLRRAQRQLTRGFATKLRSRDKTRDRTVFAWANLLRHVP